MFLAMYQGDQLVPMYQCTQGDPASSLFKGFLGLQTGSNWGIDGRAVTLILMIQVGLAFT